MDEVKFTKEMWIEIKAAIDVLLASDAIESIDFKDMAGSVRKEEVGHTYEDIVTLRLREPGDC